MNKTKTNYWIDVIIAIAFVLSATSGIVFLFPANGSSALGISYQIWDQVHTWGSLLMIAGVLAHLALHWKWIMAMTKKTFLPYGRPKTAVTMTAADVSDLNRRQFLRAAGLGAIFLGTAMIGLNSIIGAQDNETNQGEIETEDIDVETVQPAATSIPLQVVPSQSGDSSSGSTGRAPSRSGPPSRFSSPSQSSQTTMIACPKGFTYDPYPGRCHHYVDRDGDGYCDYSVPAAA